MKNVHLTAADFLEMLHIDPNTFGKYVITPGQRERLQYLQEFIEEPQRLFDVYGYEAYSGMFNGKKVTACNGGMYAPEAAIATEIFCAAGAEYVIRTGSCGGISKDVEIGDIIIATGAIRGEGTTPYYVPEGYPAIADFGITGALIKAAEKLGVKYHTGLVWTTDAMLRETKELVEKMSGLGVKAVDMVTSSMLVVSQLYQRKAGVVLAVSDNLVKGEMGFMDERYYTAERNIIHIALEAVKALGEE
jgi:DeoD family purine-nucleoside phosphorylase